MADQKLVWLKRILAVKVVLTFFLWGLPNLLFPLPLLQNSGVPIPDDPLYLRMMGAVVIAFGVAYWYAFRDPAGNTAILKAGIVDNGLVTLVTLYFVIFRDLRSPIMLGSAVFTLIFCLSFILLMPKAKTA